MKTQVRLLSVLFVCGLSLCAIAACSKPREPIGQVAEIEEATLEESPPVSPKHVPPSPPVPADKEPFVPMPKPTRALPKEVTNSLGMKLVLVPAGRFVMGSPATEKERGEDETSHEVEISQPFYLGVHEVTQNEYEQVLKKNPSHFATSGGGTEIVKGMDTRRYPVETATWKDATEFCQRLSALPGEKDAGRVYRLPTEAEWEYACRGGEATPVAGGSNLAATQANFDGSQPYGSAAKGPSLQRPVAVGSFPPNAFGLFDMHGNVWEWCADWYQEDYYRKSASKDPTGPETGLHRVMRGGCFLSAGAGCRSAVRGQAEPNSKLICTGFRVACELK